MAFQFPDPNVIPEFEGDNGITYAWDPVDEKWTIKGFSADLDDRYVNREGGDSMEGPLELTGVDGNLKFGTAGGKIVSANDTDLAVVNTSGIFYDGAISAERHLVNKEYVDEQIDEVVGLLGGIGSSNKAGVFTWQASGAITAAHWQFEGRTNPDYEYAGLNQINISKTDKAGNTWSVDDFPINEVLRIEDESDGHFLEGHITAVVDGGPASIQVTYTIDEANGTADGDQVISVGENLDHLYVERAGDSMTGNLVMDGNRVQELGEAFEDADALSLGQAKQLLAEGLSPGEDFYNALAYYTYNTSYPLTLVLRPKGWTGSAPSGQFQFDDASAPVHCGIPGGAGALSSFDPGLHVRITHTSGVMYAEIVSSWHNGGIHLNLTRHYGDDLVDGEEVINFSIQDSIFVERAGDSMTGDLEMQNSKVNFTNMDADRVALQARRAAGEDLTLLDLANASVSPAVSGFYNIKIQGNTFYNGIRIKGGSGAADTLWEVRGGSGEMKFYGGTDYQHNRLKQVGDAVEDDDALTLGQFKQELADFRDDIIADLSFGTWVYSSNNVTPIQTRFYVRGSNGSTNAVNPALVDTLIFNVQDINGSIAPFDRVDVGEMFTLSNSGIVAKYRVTAAPTNSGSQDEGRVISVAFISQSQTFSFLQDQTWNVQLTEFAEITVDALDDTYLRLDTANDPLESNLAIETPSFGEAKLTLRGKRDNSNNTCGTIAFENQDETAQDKIGYITYYNKGTTQKFQFNQDISLPGDVDLSFSNGGAIQHNGNDRVVFNSATNGNEGSGLVVFTRPSNIARRGITVRGKYVGADGSTVDEGDLLYSYTNNDVDAVNYMGKTSGDYNILNRKALADALAGFEVNNELNHTPFISNGNGTVVGVYASTVTKKQVAGFFSGGSSNGSRNQYVGNINSYLKCGHEVIAIQSGANDYANLDVGYDLEFSGIVTVINRNGGGVLYKNVCTRVQCAQTAGEEPHVKIWVRDAIGSPYGNKPMFAFGEITDWTSVSVIIEGYYLG